MLRILKWLVGQSKRYGVLLANMGLELPLLTGESTRFVLCYLVLGDSLSGYQTSLLLSDYVRCYSPTSRRKGHRM